MFDLGNRCFPFEQTTTNYGEIIRKSSFILSRNTCRPLRCPGVISKDVFGGLHSVVVRVSRVCGTHRGHTCLRPISLLII